MCSVEFRTRESDGRVVVVLRGELDVTDAARVAAALTEVAARERQIIVDLAGLEFIDSSGLAALVRVRKHARHAGGDLRVQSPLEGLEQLGVVDLHGRIHSVHACVEDAAGSAGRSSLAPASAAGRPVVLRAT